MPDPFDLADELGPYQIIHICVPAQSLRAIVVVDNVSLGPAIGGVRMAPDVSLKECAGLARAMTLKNAAAGLPHGGGKTVVFGDPQLDARRKAALLRCLAAALRGKPEYIPGPDMGTDEACMAWMHDEGLAVVGLPRELGGIPLDELGATGFGLLHAARAAAPYCQMDLSQARVAIQGFGAVGQHAARHLTEAGARVVAVADTGGAVHDPAGLDLGALVALKRAGRSVTAQPGATRISNEALIGIDCDIWVPAARPHVITESNASSVRARLVLEGANIPITPGAELMLHERGVICVPDFIANAGGVICAAMEHRGATPSAAFDVIRQTLEQNTATVLEAARLERKTPRAAATDLAMARLKKASSLRRWSSPGPTGA